MEIVISDPKSGKAFNKKTDSADIFMNKKIGDEVDIGSLGLEGYRVKITGGSDAQGFPMKNDLGGSTRKKVYVITDSKRGKRERITARGNLVGADIHQLNVKVIKEGSTDLNSLLPKEEKKEELTAKDKVMEGVKEEQEKAGLKEKEKPSKEEKGEKEAVAEEKEAPKEEKAEVKEEKKEDGEEKKKE